MSKSKVVMTLLSPLCNRGDVAQRQRGHVLKPLALMLCAISLTSCATPSQVYWDHKVKELCEKDGGVTVYEKMEISKKSYPNIKVNSNGYSILPSESMATTDDPFYLSYHTSIIHESEPRVDRTETSIVRASDKKILSTIVTYGRGGGDLIVIDHPSHFSCGSDENAFKKFNSALIIKGE